MLVDFYNKIPDDARIWIYASEKSLTKNQERYILKFISHHIQNWEAHKLPLTAGVTILEHHFIIVALDESKNRATGCSIDTLQKTIQNLEKELSINLMNRLSVFCKIGNEIQCVPSHKLGDVVKSDTLFFDLTIQKKSEIQNYLKPIREGWCNRYLNFNDKL